jgi:hypothetical protein
MNAAESTLWQRLRTTRLRDIVRGRIDGRLNWRQVIARADLPADVAGVIEQVARRSRLWRCEKVDVAQELVSHFQDGLEAGRTPAQLVESFGDPARAARLISRAKKRGRSMAWQIWRWACWSMAVLVVFYIATAVYLVMGKPSIKTDYLATINRRALAVPEDERAWPLYREAIRQIQVDYKFPEWSDHPDLSPSDPAWNEATQWLAAHQHSLQTIREAAARREMGFPVHVGVRSFPKEDREMLFTPEVIERSAPVPAASAPENMLVATHLPHLAAMRSMARLLAIDARRAVSVDDGKTAYADVVAMLEMSHHCEEQPFLVNALVAVAIQGLTFRTVQDVMSESAALWSDAQLRDLAHLIAAAQIDWHGSFRGERACIYDVVQHMYTDDGEGDGRITYQGLTTIKPLLGMLEANQLPGAEGWQGELKDLAFGVAAPASLYVFAPRAELVRRYNSLMDRQESTLDRNLWEVDPKEVTKEFEGWSRLEKLRYLPISIMFPSLAKLRYTVEAGRGQRDGVLMGIALELYHREHGAWPQTLAELSPKYLPLEPVDRLNGKPLHYLLAGDRPVVYSTGVDGDDDGGRAAKDEKGNSDSQLAGPKALGDGKTSGLDGDWVTWSTVPDLAASSGVE